MRHGVAEERGVADEIRRVSGSETPPPEARHLDAERPSIVTMLARFALVRRQPASARAEASMYVVVVSPVSRAPSTCSEKREEASPPEPF
jgi:hypothetical protein